MSIERPKLILEYIRVTIWPIILILLLIIYHEEIGKVIAKITKINIASIISLSSETGTGNINVKNESNSNQQQYSSNSENYDSKKAPELWFDIRMINFSHSECLEYASWSLNNSEFINGGVNNGTTVYGYNDKYVGAFWCIESPKMVYMVVSGPSEKLAANYLNGLVSNFESRSNR